jgi:hypothetical protein
VTSPETEMADLSRELPWLRSRTSGGAPKMRRRM